MQDVVSGEVVYVDRKVKGLYAQGDVYVKSISSLPKEAKEEIAPEAGVLVVAHSETGHHHGILANGKAARLMRGEDPFTCYLQVEGAYADLQHFRGQNPHETLRLPKGTYKIRRQREWTPEGWRAVQD